MPNGQITSRWSAIVLSRVFGESTARPAVSAVDSNGRTIWIADVHHGDGMRYVVRADEKLTAFLELELAICVSGDAYN